MPGVNVTDLYNDAQVQERLKGKHRVDLLKELEGRCLLLIRYVVPVARTWKWRTILMTVNSRTNNIWRASAAVWRKLTLSGVE